MKKLTHRCPFCHKWTTDDLSMVTHVWSKHKLDIQRVSGSGTEVVLTERNGVRYIAGIEPLTQGQPREKLLRPFDDIMFMGTAP